MTETREKPPRIETASYWAWVMRQGPRRASVSRAGSPRAPWHAYVYVDWGKHRNMYFLTRAEAIAWADREVRG